MKKRIILFFLLMSVNLYGQTDQFRWNVDITSGIVDYSYDKIVNTGWYYSNLGWNEDGQVNSPTYTHQSTVYKCLNVMAHIGNSIPLIKKDPWSLGIRPTIGFGGLFNYAPAILSNTGNYNLSYDWDTLGLKVFSSDASLCGYLRYNLDEYFESGNIVLYGGIRYLMAKDKYAMPVAGIAFGYGNWSLGISAHQTYVNFYRELSNGDLEKAKVIQNMGSLSIHYYF